ncbi:hypothetical protein CPT_Seuss68 [Caulobacter phage Seuss]|uniref:Uncharacterized protein n=1 Tax=Caulobacter phage Seuss TaxID=1675601 RepID=A0A0K1LMA1_9CAUD|nr:hypothetical protein HOR08_gp068 [Caulobacter phage Seuss]AKU43594.1 hypothetical protein CPT_Seuss68 [Caulobacter phage Seuss]
MAKTASQYQEGDLVTIKGLVESVGADGNIRVKLDTHLDHDALDLYDQDLTLLKRPLKNGDPVKYGTRKPKFGTFQEEVLGGQLSVVLVAGGNKENLNDFETVKTIDLSAATEAELQAAIHQASAAPTPSE